MTRERILDAAREILDSGVYGHLTVDAIARLMHMSKSTLYKYFASKEDVVVALVGEACDATEQEIEDHAEELAGAEPVSALETLLDIYANHGGRLPRAVILQPQRTPLACRKRIALTRSRVADLCSRVITRGFSHGSFHFQRPDLLATAIVASAEATIEAAARGELSEDRAESVRALYPLFLPGVTPV